MRFTANLISYAKNYPQTYDDSIFATRESLSLSLSISRARRIMLETLGEGLGYRRAPGVKSNTAEGQQSRL